MNSTTIKGTFAAPKGKIALVAAQFNDFIVQSLIEGARDALLRHGVAASSIEVVRVPGAFEIPLIAKKCAESGRYDAIIALGAVIRGATPHFDYVAASCASGIQNVALETGIPVHFGVLTTDSIEQAIERAGTKAGNKGFEAAMACLETLDVLRELHGAV